MTTAHPKHEPKAANDAKETKIQAVFVVLGHDGSTRHGGEFETEAEAHKFAKDHAAHRAKVYDAERVYDEPNGGYGVKIDYDSARKP